MQEAIPRLEAILAGTLQFGTWIASFLLAVGWLLSLMHFDSTGNQVMIGGIGLMISLPIIRLFVMIFGFRQEREYHLAGIAAGVLAIIAISFFVGLSLKH